MFICTNMKGILTEPEINKRFQRHRGEARTMQVHQILTLRTKITCPPGFRFDDPVTSFETLFFISIELTPPLVQRLDCDYNWMRSRSKAAPANYDESEYDTDCVHRRKDVVDGSLSCLVISCGELQIPPNALITWQSGDRFETFVGIYQ